MQIEVPLNVPTHLVYMIDHAHTGALLRLSKKTTHARVYDDKLNSIRVVTEVSDRGEVEMQREFRCCWSPDIASSLLITAQGAGTFKLL